MLKGEAIEEAKEPLFATLLVTPVFYCVWRRRTNLGMAGRSNQANQRLIADFVVKARETTGLRETILATVPADQQHQGQQRQHEQANGNILEDLGNV